MEKNHKFIFTPYYINQSRLFDIYAIINDGYNEYSEISESVSQTKDKESTFDSNLSTSGFKIFKFDFGGQAKRFKSNKNNSQQSHRKVQTIASMLSLVRKDLKNNALLKQISSSEVGDFIEIPVSFKFNSYKQLMSEIETYVTLYSSLSKINKQNASKSTLNEINKINEVINQLFSGDELLHISEEYAIIANFYDSNLYQSSRSDLINTQLFCLAQIKKVFPSGTELMQNTTFSKIKEESMKNNILKALTELSSQDSLSFDSSPISKINDRPVYQIEILALYQ